MCRPSEEEERSSDVEEEKSIPKRPGAREVIEELRRRLAHKAARSPPVCRVRALCASESSDNDWILVFSFQPGTIMTIHRLSEAAPGWMYGTWFGKKGWVHADKVEILD